MKLNELKPCAGSKHSIKKVGRGIGSGLGKTSGRGHKGQKSRSGGKVPLWFEGGQMPLQRRLPKRGFCNIFAKKVEIVNLKDFDRIGEETQVSTEELIKYNLIKHKESFIKILGNGDLSKSLTIKAHAFSKSAKEKIEKAGGKVELI
ncbi:MAG: 50S ribosomal protein L15 [Pseudomonadota bacterium]